MKGGSFIGNKIHICFWI